MNKFDFMGKDAVSKMEDLMNASRLNELLHKKEEEEKKKNCILWVLAIFGAVAAVAAIAYGVYRFFTPDYLEDFEDDLTMILMTISLRMRTRRCLSEKQRQRKKSLRNKQESTEKKERLRRLPASLFLSI